MAFNPFRGGEFGDEDSYSAGRRKDPSEWAMQEKPVPKVYGSTKDIDVDKALADQFAEAEAYRDHLLNNDKMYTSDLNGLTAYPLSTSAVGATGGNLPRLLR